MEPPEAPVGVVHYGLGPIGLAVAALVAERPWLRSVAAVDVGEELRDRSLSDLTGRPSASSPRVTAAYRPVAGASVALLCTSSSLERVARQVVELADAGLHVVSTTEELSYPWDAHPQAAAEIDAAARRAGVTVLGTGINPGFAMDYLAIVLSAVAQRVDRVEVHRVQDAGTRRVPLQRKVGAGMTPDAFRAAVGWQLTGFEEHIDPICAEAPTPMAGGVVPAGHVLGLHQRAVGRAGDVEVVSLTLDMAVGAGPARDHVPLV